MLNSINVMGRITREPELRRTDSGTAVCSFSIANERDFKNTNGERETDFLDCVAWRNTAEFISEYFHKGAMIVVNGRLQTRSYTDKDGNKRRAFDIVVNNAYFSGEKAQNATQTATTSKTDASGFVILEEDNADLPF